MELGIFSKVYHGQALSQALSAAQKDGFRFLHMNLETLGIEKAFDEIPAGLDREMVRAFADTSIHPVTISATYNLIHPDDAVLKGCLNRVSGLIKLAGKAGIPYAAICTGTNDPFDMWAPHRENQSKESWRRLLTSLEYLLPICEGARVQLLIEPEKNNVIASPQDARRLLDELRSPFLGVIMDACNLADADTIHHMTHTLLCAFDLLAEDIYLAHAKDMLWDGREQTIRFVPAGRGCLDYSLYISQLKSLPRSCPLLLHGLSSGDIPLCSRFIREIWETNV